MRMKHCRIPLLLLLLLLGHHGSQAAPRSRRSDDTHLDRQLAGLAKLLLQLSLSKSSQVKASQADSITDKTLLNKEMLSSSNSDQKDPEAWPGFDPDEIASCSSQIVRNYTNENRPKRKSAGFKSLPTCGINMFMMAKLREDKRSSVRSQVEKLQHLLGLDTTYKQLERDGKDLLHNIVSKKDDIEERIVGGHQSPRGRFPWMAGVGILGYRLFCGAALISDQWVLSAAHCFRSFKSPCRLNIRVGATDWREDLTGHHVDQTPEYVIPHPDYSPETFNNDIALIKLPRPVPVSPDSFINPVCLPDLRFPVGDDCVAAGWGTTEEGNISTAPDRYDEVMLKIQPQHNCKFNVTENQFCAGNMAGGVDTCQGDSGGPLVCKKNGQWQQFGVTSYGNGCGHPGYPGIYTDVSQYWEFIQDVIARY